MTGEDPASFPCRHVYVHVPFCARRCSYCDFSIAVRRTVPTADFIRGIERELDIRRASTHVAALETLYLGGGTPSRLGGDGIRRLLDVLRHAMPLAPDAEVTLEANPEDITDDAVRAWREAGITRLSIGVQSFNDAVLRWMHRVHDAAAADRAVRTARDGGLGAFSLDLIFAVPPTLERDWAKDLAAVLAYEPDHISLYGLTIETHTPLGKWRARGAVVDTSDESYEEEFLSAHLALDAAGYEHYEVSNFARPARRSRHNSAYWTGVSYLGVGPSAHGYNGCERRWNTAAYAAWVGEVSGGADPVAGREVLTAENRLAEWAYLGLRTRDGLRLDAATVESVLPWVDAGWIEWIGAGENRRARCTPLGWLRLDRLAGDLTALRSH